MFLLIKIEKKIVTVSINILFLKTHKQTCHATANARANFPTPWMVNKTRFARVKNHARAKRCQGRRSKRTS
jgi:hypothetical protein